jgi:glutathione S-transferase
MILNIPKELFYTMLVTIVSLLVYFTQGIMVGVARSKFKVSPPTTTGNPDFERYFRVHYNTLEQLPIFLATLWIFALTINVTAANILGLVWSLARIAFAYGYYKEAGLRRPGGVVSSIVGIILIIGSIIGITMGIMR